MRVEDAFGVSGGSGGVAEAAGSVFVDGDPGAVSVGLGDEFVEHDEVGEFAVRGRGAGEEHALLEGGQLLDEPFDDGNEGCVEKEDSVVGVLDDVGQLVGEEAWVEGVADGSGGR